MKKWQCADCEYNTGDNGDGCRCEKTGKEISIWDKACKKFRLYSDIDDITLYDGEC